MSAFLHFLFRAALQLRPHPAAGVGHGIATGDAVVGSAHSQAECLALLPPGERLDRWMLPKLEGGADTPSGPGRHGSGGSLRAATKSCRQAMSA